MGEVIRSEQFWAAHRAMHMAAWQIAHKRAKDRGETVLRPEAVEAVYEELKQHLRRERENKPAESALDSH